MYEPPPEVLAAEGQGQTRGTATKRANANAIGCQERRRYRVEGMLEMPPQKHEREGDAPPQEGPNDGNRGGGREALRQQAQI